MARVRRAGGWLISLDGRARLAAGFHAATPVQLVIGFGDTDARAIADGVAAIAPLLS